MRYEKKILPEKACQISREVLLQCSIIPLPSFWEEGVPSPKRTDLLPLLEPVLAPAFSYF